MTGPERYLRAERLLDHAAGMLDADVAAEERAELIARQAVAVTMAHAHAALAAAAVAGLSAHLDTLDTRAWRDAAATRITS
jgi:hypothetical protein